MAITIAGTAAGLNRYAIQFKTDINTKIRQKLVTEGELTARVADHTWTAPSVTTSDLIQAFQCDFTPNNTHTFDEDPVPLQRLKVDLEFSCDDMEGFYDTFFHEWDEFGSGKKPEDWRFPAWIYEKEIYPKLEEEMELLIAYKGIRVAPTTGVAGTPAASCDGLGKKIADAITAGRIAGRLGNHRTRQGNIFVFDLCDHSILSAIPIIPISCGFLRWLRSTRLWFPLVWAIRADLHSRHIKLILSV